MEDTEQYGRPLEAQDLESSKLRSPSPDIVRVLVVDDCRQLREVVEEVLLAHGFEVLSAANASEALTLLAKTRPDLIISDIMMPGLDGYRFNLQVRENPEWSDIPFIFLTALSEPDDVRRGKSLGCDDYLVKPFDPLDLVSVIRGKVARARQLGRQADDRLEKYRRRLIHTLSHEFRTPLVAINTGAELLLERQDEGDHEQFQKLLQAVHRGGLRLQRLVEDFMALQQIDAGTALTTARRLQARISLVDVAESAIEFFRDTANEDPLTINFTVRAEGSVIVDICETQISNCLQRLLNNAQKFSPTGSPIDVTVRSNGTQAFLSVRDRGPGLPEHIAREACKTFTQIDRDKNEQQGCGLGLTIACYYARINGAEISFAKPEDNVGLDVVLAFTAVR